MKWKSIDSAPIRRYPMFVIKAINVDIGGGKRYTSDPYCTWRDDNDGGFARWPHEFPPTHWCELPSDDD